jgi:hypothetical protein
MFSDIESAWEKGYLTREYSPSKERRTSSGSPEVRAAHQESNHDQEDSDNRQSFPFLQSAFRLNALLRLPDFLHVLMHVLGPPVAINLPAGIGTASSALRSMAMQIFTYSITDLTEYESEPIEVTFETDDEAVTYGAVVAHEMLARMPDLTYKGMCITVLDEQGETISIVPLDPVN